MAAEVRPRLRREPARRSLQLGYLGIATRRALAGGSSSALIPTLSFDFTTGTMVSTKGNVTPTFTRATAKSIVDWEGNVLNILSGEVPINGLRRVFNRLTNTENLTAWTKSGLGVGSVPTVTAGFVAPDGSATAFRLQASLNGGVAGGDQSFISPGVAAPVAGDTTRRSVWIKSNTGASQTVGLCIGGTSESVAATTVWQRLSPAAVANINSFAIGQRGSFVAGGENDTIDVLVWHPQWEVVTGQSNQNPGEYVPVGVLSSPFYGVNVDGVRYFSWQNGNTVASNVVTEAAGAALPNGATWPAAYRPEIQSTNLVLQSENFGTTWVAVGTPTRTGAAVNVGSLNLDLIGDDDAAALEGYTQVVGFTGDGVKAVSLYVKKGTATSSVVRLRDTTGAANRLLMAITWTGNVPTATMTTGTLIGVFQAAGNVYRIEMLTTAATAANTNSLEVYPATDNTLAVAAVGNINVGGVQAENQTLFCTSYIPTTTGTVTRNKDQMVVSSLGAWFNPLAGTLVAKYINPPVGGTAFGFAMFSDGTANNRIYAFQQNPSAPELVITVATVNTTAILNGNNSLGALHKTAMTWDGTTNSIVTDGGAITGPSAGAIPSGLTQLEIAQAAINVQQFTGLFQGLDYYASRVANADFQRLTA